MTLIRNVFHLIRETFAEYGRHKCPRLGASLAFYTLLSLAPLLLIVIGLVGPLAGADNTRGQVVDQFRELVGDEGAKAVDGMLDSTKSPSGGVLSTVIGLVVLVFSAANLFIQLQDALNTVWNVPDRPAKYLGIWRTVKNYLLSFSTVLGLGFLLLVSLVLGAGLSGMQKWVEGRIGGGSWWLHAANVLLSFALAAFLFAFIYKVLPTARVSWRSVLVGALVTAGLFTLGKFLIGLYLGQAAPGSAFGAAGSLVVLLIWVYYSTQLLLLGAEFTQIYATKFGGGVKYRGAKADPAQTPAPLANRGGVTTTPG
jgi:membrane protein